MAFYGAQGAVDAFQQMPVNRMHQLQGDQLGMQLAEARRRLAAEPMLGQTWYELAANPQAFVLPQPPMPGQGSVPMTPPMGPPGPAGLYPPPQATMLPRPSPLAGMMAPAGVPPGVPLPNPAMMQGQMLPEQPQLPQPLYRPLRPGVIGDGASRLPPLMPTRSMALDTGQTKIPPPQGKPASQLPIGRDEQGNPVVSETGEPGVQAILDMANPGASQGMSMGAGRSMVPPPMGPMAGVGGGASLPLPPSGGMSRMPAGGMGSAPVGPDGQVQQGGGMPRPSFLDSPDMMAFIRAARAVGVKPEDLPQMVERASPIMAKEMLAAQAAERAAARTYELKMRDENADLSRDLRERVEVAKELGRGEAREETKRYHSALIEHWEKEHQLDEKKLKVYEAKVNAVSAANNLAYRTTLEKYKQEMQNQRSIIQLASSPYNTAQQKADAMATLRDQRIRVDQMQKLLDDLSGTTEPGTVIEPAAGTTQLGGTVDQSAAGTTLQAPRQPGEVVEFEGKQYRYKGPANNPAASKDRKNYEEVR